MPVKEFVYYDYVVVCDGCNDSPGHVKESSSAVEQLALGDGWKIWEIPATNRPGDPESFLVILCPKCAA